MILDQFLADLVARGGSLRVEHDRLLFRGPPGSIAACDEEFIRENKAELIERIHSTGPIEPIVEEAVPAWFDAAALAIRTADVRASIEDYQASCLVETRPSRSGDRSRRVDPSATAGPVPTTRPPTQGQASDELHDQGGVRS